MNVPQNWRLNKQRYQLVAVRDEATGVIAFPPRSTAPQPTAAVEATEVTRLPRMAQAELQKAGR
ncbi:MAG TPA: hypothetical protein PLD47_05350 [Aggregatilineales bacterium]|nr:hypothetical protein [Anaerolineales bacterium]HRE47131.1 hypothetical protein [Aggregatilineales bacterium]